jgi:nitrogen fixation protein FixH
MSSSARPGTVTGRHVLLTFIGFFLVVFAVNGIMIYKAETTFGGLDTVDAYRKGLAYNERIAAAAAQGRLGWRDRTEYVPQTRRVRVTLTDAAGAPVSGLTVTAELQRPATSRFDRQLFLVETGPATYEGDVSELEPGAWTVDIAARHSDKNERYEARRRLWIAP